MMDDREVIRDIVSEMMDQQSGHNNHRNVSEMRKKRSHVRSHHASTSLTNNHAILGQQKPGSIAHDGESKIRSERSSLSQASCYKLIHTQVEVHPAPSSSSTGSPTPINSTKKRMKKKSHSDTFTKLPDLVMVKEVTNPAKKNSTFKIRTNQDGDTKPIRNDSEEKQKPDGKFSSRIQGSKTLTEMVSEEKNIADKDLRKSSSPTSFISSHSPESFNQTMNSEMSTLNGPDKEQIIGEKMRCIIGHIRARANKVRDRLESLPSPQDDDDSVNGSGVNDFNHATVLNGNSKPHEDEGETKNPLFYQQQQIGNAHFRGRNFGALERIVFDDYNSSLYASKSTIVFDEWRNFFDFKRIRKKLEFIDPRGYVNIAWLFLLAIIFLYNAWVIPLRAIFPFAKTSLYPGFWLTFDYLGDVICWLDIIIYKPRLMFIENGFWVKSKERLIRHYIQEGSFRQDLLALLPADLFYLWFGMDATYLRLPRLLKVFSYWEFIERVDAILEKPYILRIVKTVNYMLYLIHINACAYYGISALEGIGKNSFVYDGEGNSYIRCFYFATKTATSIGKNKKPTNIEEIIFMTGSWLMGVFVFAILIGDIRDIVSNARVNVLTYQQHLDAITAYMNNNKVPRKVQDRVKRWMYYTWSTQKSFNENKIMEFLPLKMRTDIAMRVHFSTLGKVKLFRNCEPGLLKDLVVLLRPVIYLPGDYVCRKGDIGKEMFILQSGQVQVLGGMDGRKVVVTLGQGSVFGEIALLGVGGMNRRTADVISRGFTNVFVLQKDDLEEVLKDYPDAKRILNARARKLMKENEDRIAHEMTEQDQQRKKFNSSKNHIELTKIPSEMTLANSGQAHPKSDPAMLNAVIRMLPAHSKVYEYFKRQQASKIRAEPPSLGVELTTDMDQTPVRAPSTISLDEVSRQVLLSERYSGKSHGSPHINEDIFDVNMKCYGVFRAMPEEFKERKMSPSENLKDQMIALKLLQSTQDTLNGPSIDNPANSPSTTTRQRREKLRRQGNIDFAVMDPDETTFL